MVNVQLKRASHKSCTPRRARGVEADVEVTACSRRQSDIANSSMSNLPSPSEVVGGRKRSRSGLDREHSRHGLDHDLVQDSAVIETAEMGPNKGVPHASSSVVLGRHLNGNTTGTSAKRPRRTMPNTVPAPLPQAQSLTTIKTEAETLVMF